MLGTEKSGVLGVGAGDGGPPSPALRATSPRGERGAESCFPLLPGRGLNTPSPLWGEGARRAGEGEAPRPTQMDPPRPIGERVPEGRVRGGAPAYTKSVPLSTQAELQPRP